MLPKYCSLSKFITNFTSKCTKRHVKFLLCCEALSKVRALVKKNRTLIADYSGHHDNLFIIVYIKGFVKGFGHWVPHFEQKHHIPHLQLML